MPNDEPKTFSVTVDGEPVEIPRKDMTPDTILRQAGLDPAERYLIEIKGSKQFSYKGKGGDPINVHAHQTFITAFIGAVPVSR